MAKNSAKVMLLNRAKMIERSSIGFHGYYEYVVNKDFLFFLAYLGNKGAFRSQEISGQPDRIHDQGRLGGGFLRPGASNVRRPIMEDDIEGGAAVGVHKALDGSTAFGGGDVLDKGVSTANRSDWEEINAEDERAYGSMINSYLEPPAGSGAKVEDGAGGGEEPVFGVELEELEGGARAVALLLGEVVILVLTLLPLHLAHRRRRSSRSTKPNTREVLYIN